MTRRGKIARLPQPIREQINRRLQNGEEGIQIIQWLNALPEVIAQMISEFGGQPVNETAFKNTQNRWGETPSSRDLNGGQCSPNSPLKNAR